MIRYSFVFMDDVSYSRFENWLYNYFQITPEDVDENHQILETETGITGIISVPEEKHEAFLEQWAKDSSPMRMALHRMR